MRIVRPPFIGTAAAGGGQTINADYVSSSAAVYQPTLSTVATINADYLASAAQVYQPTVTAEQTISADYLASASAVYQPTLTTGTTINADYLASAAQVYQPDLTTLATISADYLGSSASVYQPTLTIGLTIAADYLSSAAAVYQPTITTVATISADYVSSASVVYQPTLELTLQTINADYVASNAAVYQPTITGGAIAEGSTGGWYYEDWTPTKAQIKKQREELGITKPEINQITRAIKKVSKGQVEPEKAESVTQDYFKQNDLEYQPKHKEVVSNLVDFINRNRTYNPVDFATKQASVAAKEAQEASDYQALVEELRIEAEMTEEQDMVFVIAVLAA